MSTPDIEWIIDNSKFRATRIAMAKRHGRSRPTSFWRIYKDDKRIDNRLNREAIRRYRKRLESDG